MLAVPQPERPSAGERPFWLGSGFDRDLQQHLRKHRQHAETQENTILDKTALDGDPASRTSVADAPAGEGAPLPQGTPPSEVGAKVDHRGEAAPVRRILVECGLCGFLVRIPPEFFGKTVHCPECAGDAVFTESTLDPVKDELIDRLVLETGERKVLFDPPAGNGARRGLVDGRAARSFLIGVALGLLVLALVYLLRR